MFKSPWVPASSARFSVWCPKRNEGPSHVPQPRARWKNSDGSTNPSAAHLGSIAQVLAHLGVTPQLLTFIYNECLWWSFHMHFRRVLSLPFGPECPWRHADDVDLNQSWMRYLINTLITGEVIQFTCTKTQKIRTQLTSTVHDKYLFCEKQFSAQSVPGSHSPTRSNQSGNQPKCSCFFSDCMWGGQRPKF